MPFFVVERQMPGVGSVGETNLKVVSLISCTALEQLGPEIQWLHSYVTDDKVYGVYEASSEGLIRQHARKTGFQIHSVVEIRAMIDPTWSEWKTASPAQA